MLGSALGWERWYGSWLLFGLLRLLFGDLKLCIIIYYSLKLLYPFNYSYADINTIKNMTINILMSLDSMLPYFKLFFVDFNPCIFWDRFWLFLDGSVTGGSYRICSFELVPIFTHLYEFLYVFGAPSERIIDNYVEISL